MHDGLACPAVSKVSYTLQEKAYSCPESDCSYTIKSNLLRHQRSKHGKESKGRFTCEVPACMKSFFHASKLVQHYKEDHDMEMGMYVQYSQESIREVECQTP